VTYPNPDEIIWSNYPLVDLNSTSTPPSNERLWVSKYPVTVAQFNNFINSGGYINESWWSSEGWKWKNHCGISMPLYWNDERYRKPDFPITGVSFWEAEAFSNFANARLPTEGEWTYICSNRGISCYPWGDDQSSIALERANLSFFGVFRKQGLVPVDTFPKGVSDTGIYDLLGNVSEWCVPDTPIQTHKDSPEDLAILKGGCSWHAPYSVDCDSRDVAYQSIRDNQTGIRLFRGHRIPKQLLSKTAVQRMPYPSSASDLLARRPTEPFRQEGIPTELNLDNWRLTLSGLIKNPDRLSFKDLKTNFSKHTVDGLFVCVCRWAQQNKVSGVALKDLIKFVEPTVDVSELFIIQRSFPGKDGKIYETTIPLEDAIKRNAILCYELDGKPLSMELGWPLRLIDFGLYGYKQVKCLSEIEFTTTCLPGWWEKDAQYDPSGRIQSGTVTLIGTQLKKIVL